MKKCFKLLSAALIALASFVPAQADELTVYDEASTNEFSPIYGYYYDTPGNIVSNDPSRGAYCDDLGGCESVR